MLRSAEVPLRRFLGVYFLTLFALFAASARRLLDLAPAKAPLALWSPFLNPLVGAACEMALLVAIPAAALCARASQSSQRATIVAALGLALPTTVAAFLLDTSGAAPGRVAQQLIDAARDACLDAPDHRVAVPLLPLSWSCAGSSAPVASGRLPSGVKASFQLHTIRVSSDLRRIDAEQFVLDAPPTPARLGLHLQVNRARLTGLSPWGRPRDLPVSHRLLRSLVIGAALVAAGLALLARRPLGAWSAAALGWTTGIILVMLQRALDRHNVAELSYWLALIVGPVVLIALGVMLDLAQRRWAERSGVARREA